MSAPTNESHYYSPQNCIVDVVNARFFGLYDLRDLPSYYRPSEESIAFAERLMDRVVQAGDVELIIDDEPPHIGCLRPVDTKGVTSSLRGIIGPEGLELQLDGREGGSSWLWDRGTFKQTGIIEG